MARMGRPRKDNAKRESITIRMSEDTHKKLTEYAARHNVNDRGCPAKFGGVFVQTELSAVSSFFKIL